MRLKEETEVKASNNRDNDTEAQVLTQGPTGSPAGNQGDQTSQNAPLDSSSTVLASVPKANNTQSTVDGQAADASVFTFKKEECCAVCGKTALCRCSNCNNQFYCGRECQLKVRMS